jgi:hypothetical protein
MTTPARVKLTADCQAAATLDLPEAHMRCRARGALRIPAFTAPVLPAEKCGCECHKAGESDAR